MVTNPEQKPLDIAKSSVDLGKKAVEDGITTALNDFSEKISLMEGLSTNEASSIKEVISTVLDETKEVSQDQLNMLSEIAKSATAKDLQKELEWLFGYASEKSALDTAHKKDLAALKSLVKKEIDDVIAPSIESVTVNSIVDVWSLKIKELGSMDATILDMAKNIDKNIDKSLLAHMTAEVNMAYGRWDMRAASRAAKEYGHYATLLSGEEKAQAERILANFKDKAPELFTGKTPENKKTLDHYKSDLYKQTIESETDQLEQAKSIRAMEEYNKNILDLALRARNKEYLDGKTGVLKDVEALIGQKTQKIVDVTLEKKEKSTPEKLMKSFKEDFDPLKKEWDTIAFADILWDFNFDGSVDGKDLGTINWSQIAYAFSDAFRANRPVVGNVIDVMMTGSVTPEQKKALEEVAATKGAESLRIQEFYKAIKADPTLLLLFQNSVKAANINSIDVAQWMNFGFEKSVELSEEERKMITEKLAALFKKETGKEWFTYAWGNTTFLGSFFDGLKGLGLNRTEAINIFRDDTFNSKLNITFGGFGNADLDVVMPYIGVTLANSAKLWKNVTARVAGWIGMGMEGLTFTIPMPHASAGFDIVTKRGNKDSLDANKQAVKKISPTFYISPLTMGGEVELDIKWDRIAWIEEQTDVVADKIAKALGEVAAESATTGKNIYELLKDKFPKTSDAKLKDQAQLLQQVVELSNKSGQSLDAKALAEKFSQEWRNESLMALDRNWQLKSVAPGVVLIGGFMPAPTLRAKFSKITEQYYAESKTAKLQRDIAIQEWLGVESETLSSSEKLEKLQTQAPEFVSVIDNKDGTITVKLNPEHNTAGLNMLDPINVYVADSAKEFVKIDQKTWEVTMPINLDSVIYTVYGGNKVVSQRRSNFFARLFAGKNEKVSKSGDVEFSLVIGTDAAKNAALVERGNAWYTGEKMSEYKEAVGELTDASLNELLKTQAAGKLEKPEAHLAGEVATIAFDVPEWYDVPWYGVNTGRLEFAAPTKWSVLILRDDVAKKIYIQKSPAEAFSLGIERSALKSKDVFPDLEKPSIENIWSVLEPKEVVKNRYTRVKQYNAFISAMHLDLNEKANLDKVIVAAKALFAGNEKFTSNDKLNKADMYALNGLLAMVPTTENKWYGDRHELMLNELDPENKAPVIKTEAEMLSMVAKVRNANAKGKEDLMAKAALMKMPLGILMNYREKGTKTFLWYKKRMLNEGFSQSAVDLYATSRNSVGEAMKNDTHYWKATLNNAVALVYWYTDNGIDEKFTTHPEIATKQNWETTFNKFDRKSPATQEIVKKFLDTVEKTNPDMLQDFKKVVDAKLGRNVSIDEIKAAIINNTGIDGLPIHADFGFAFYANCFNESIVMQWLQIGEVDVQAEWVKAESVLGVWVGAVTNEAHAGEKQVAAAILGNWIRKQGKGDSWTTDDPNQPDNPDTDNPDTDGDGADSGSTDNENTTDSDSWSESAD